MGVVFLRNDAKPNPEFPNLSIQNGFEGGSLPGPSGSDGGFPMFRRLMEGIFGCSHTNYSFPRSHRPGQRRTGAAAMTGMYVVCLDCGKEFPYDWSQMRVIHPDQKPETALAEPARSFATK